MNAINLCLVTAVAIEFKTAASLLSEPAFSSEDEVNICRGYIEGSPHRRVSILQSGMGAIGFADRLSRHLAHHRYDALLVVGLAGGLDPRLKPGAAVVYHRCHDGRDQDAQEPASLACDERFSNLVFEALQTARLPCVLGAGLTTARIITEAKEKIRLGHRRRASAVDMETFDVLKTCLQHGLPATALRIISDEARENLPDFNRAVNADGRMIPWQVAMAMFARPMASWHFLWHLQPVVQALRINLAAALQHQSVLSLGKS